MKASRLVFLVAVVLTLSAGVVVGRLSVLVPQAHEVISEPPATMPSDHRGDWKTQLNLRADQQQEMDAIWKDIKPNIEKTFEARRAAEKKRDDAIQELLASTELGPAYDKIISDYHTAHTDIDKQREQLIHDAEDKSRALLDEDQQKKWDVLSKQMHEGAWTPVVHDKVDDPSR